MSNLDKIKQAFADSGAAVLEWKELNRIQVQMRGCDFLTFWEVDATKGPPKEEMAGDTNNYVFLLDQLYRISQETGKPAIGYKVTHWHELPGSLYIPPEFSRNKPLDPDIFSKKQEAFYSPNNGDKKPFQCQGCILCGNRQYMA
jgi:hypothetical protein